MIPSSIQLAVGLFFLASSVLAQQDGYFGYKLEQRGDPDSAIYSTDDTNPDAQTAVSEPDVYLNASVYVGEIDIEVDNLTAKINLEAQVLNLLTFSAGVDASIDKVSLTIKNVSAEVLLEARLENVFNMIDDVLSSIDLNPIIATLGNDVNNIVNTTVGAIEDGGSLLSSRGINAADLYNLEHNVLYSVNDYSGQTHTNRILAQNGSIYDVKLNNDGVESSRQLVGSYLTDMTFNGHNRTISVNGVATEYELQYVYTPFPGLEVISYIWRDTTGKVLKTQVIAEAYGGGTSTVSDDSDL